MSDGGPAFPMPSGPEPRVNEITHFNEGMSLRDYFAVHAPMPEPSYICEAMGWERDLRIGDDDEIGSGDQWQDSMLARWHELPTPTRMAVTCRHAYEYADAMLAARERKPEPAQA